MTISNEVTIEQVIKVLNRALKADPEAMTTLFTTRVKVGLQLAQDPTIQVLRVAGSTGRVDHTLSFLGLLNGFFGVDDDLWGAVTAVWDKGRILRFEDNGRR